MGHVHVAFKEGRTVKLYIMTDLEGAAGVNRWVQTREGETIEKAAAMRLLTHEVNAAVQGILDAEPNADIVVWDGHGSGGLVFDELHPRARVVRHGQGMGAPHCLDGSFDALFFIGQHAMAGTPSAPLCHTYSSRTVEHYMLNGMLVGEIGCLTAMAGALGVPAVFLSGDDKACAEAKALVPDMVTVATKVGLGLELALHLSAEASRQAIRVGASQAAGLIGRIPSLKMTGPFELLIRVKEGCSIETYLNAGMERVDQQTVVARDQNLIALFQG